MFVSTPHIPPHLDKRKFIIGQKSNTATPFPALQKPQICGSSCDSSEKPECIRRAGWWCFPFETEVPPANDAVAGCRRKVFFPHLATVLDLAVQVMFPATSPCVFDLSNSRCSPQLMRGCSKIFALMLMVAFEKRIVEILAILALQKNSCEAPHRTIVSR